jgi:hypothetical protein
MQGTNVANLVVTVNGKRLQPPEGIEWTGDGTSSSFGLPQRGKYPQSAINAYTDIQVWLNNVLQVQNFGTIVGDYYVTNWDGSNTPGRQVVFFTPPADGAQIFISVSTIAQYTVVIGSPNRLLITPLLNLGDQIAITSWNDTSQQDPLTLVFVGPITTGLTLVEPYDSTDYDPLFVDDTSTFTGEYPAGQFIVGNSYTIDTAGTTNFVALGAADSNPGTVFVATGSGSFGANGLVSGRSYTIKYVGTTDWTLLGAASSTFNTTFTANATGTGVGTGTLTLEITAGNTSTAALTTKGTARPAKVEKATVAVTITAADLSAINAATAAGNAATAAAEAATDAAAEAIDAANAATDAANLAAEAADAATVAAEEARDAADAATAAVEELATQVATLMAALKAQITTLANTVAKIAKKVKA